MRILAQKLRHSAIDGFEQAAIANNNTWVWWNSLETSVYKAFDYVRPDIFFSAGEQSYHVMSCIIKYNTKLWLQTKQFTFVVNGKEFSYDGLVDDITYRPIRENDLACDIGTYTSVFSPSPFFLQLCYPINKFKIKAIGEHAWKIPQYLGKCSTEDKVKLYSNARVVFCNTIYEKYQAEACGSHAILHDDNITIDEFNLQLEKLFDRIPKTKLTTTYTQALQDFLEND